MERRSVSISKAVLPFFFVGLILFFRNPVAYTRAEFWAEDGANFFAESYALGWKSLIFPLGGYQNFISRAWAAFATFLPVLWTPYLFSTFALVVSSVCLGIFSRNAYRWLVESRALRWLLCLLFAVAPGATEVTQAICNLHTVFTLAVALWFLGRPLRMAYASWVFFVLLVFSTPELPILVPLLLCLFWKFRDRTYLVAVGIILSALFINAFTSAKYSNGAYGLEWHRFGRVPFVILERLFLYTTLIPMTGPILAAKIFSIHNDGIFWLLLSAVATGFTFLYARLTEEKRKPLRWALLIATTGASTFGLMFITRPYLNPLISRFSGELFWQSRYAFVPTATALVAWTIALGPWLRVRKLRWGACALLAAPILFFPSQPAPRPDVNWPEKAREIEAAVAAKDGRAVRGIKLQPNAYAEFELFPK